MGTFTLLRKDRPPTYRTKQEHSQPQRLSCPVHSLLVLGQSSVRHADYQRFVRESYIRNVRMFSGRDLPHTIELLSDHFFRAWERNELRTDVFGRPSTLGGPIGFCYIDGDHSYKQSKRDFENADRHLLPGGFILFDDSADGTKFEVGRLIEEVKRRDDYRVVVKNPNYLVQKLA